MLNRSNTTITDLIDSRRGLSAGVFRFSSLIFAVSLMAFLLGTIYAQERPSATREEQRGGQADGQKKCVAPPQGMVAWWPLDETSGSTVTDIISGFNGTAAPGPISSSGSSSGPTTFLPSSFPSGMVGGSLFFGSLRHITVPHNSNLDPGSGEFAVDAWFIWGGGSGPIIQKMLPNGQGWGIFIVPSNTNPSLGTIELRWKFTSGLSMPTLSFPISINQWYHVYAGLRRNNPTPSTAMTVFALNGSGFLNMTASVSPTDTIATNAPLLIGGDGIYPGARIAIDEIEIFRRWLVSTEVKPIYEAGSLGKCKTKEAPDLAIEKKVTSSPTAGGFVNYQIKVTNVGTSSMPGPITVTDTLGSGLSFVSTGAGGGWSCTQSGGTITCTHPGPVPAGGSLPIITVMASVAPNAEIIENCATVAGPMKKAPGGPAITLLVPIEGNLSNNKSCVKTDVKPGPKFDLMVNKEPVGQFSGGQNASYQIVVTNNGSAPASGPITVKDVLGSGLTYVTASGSGWTCTNAGQTVTCTHPGPVPANGALPPLTLTVNVGKGVTEVKNCATVKIVEQPPTKPGESWVFIPDANPDNDETCVTSPVTNHPIDPLPPCVTHPLNLIAWWPMDETNGSSAIVDIVGGHNGNTLVGALGSVTSSPE